ncbi:hypothetical protein [Citrobacter phage Ci1]|nr:hypothetical protein [Citrobacter phage Ci1]
MIKQYVKGNLVKMMIQAVEHDTAASRKTFFTHGCNCHAAMGSGIAPQIAKAFPQVEEQDRLFYNYMSRTGRQSLMLGESNPVSLSRNVTVFNSYTQFYPGKDFRLHALFQAFSKIDTMIAGHTLIIPRIGAGVAGGDWEEISKAIDKSTPDVNIIVVDWDGTL